MRLGIDFGTTRTVVAAAVHGRYPVAAFDTTRGFLDYLPGMAAAARGRLNFGWDVLRALGDDATAAVPSLKRTISGLAPDDRVLALDRDVTALELVTRYLAFARRMLVERSNLEILADEPLEAMVAVPANVGTRQRYLTLEAFQQAGFRVIGMVNEPTAASIEYAYRNLGAVGRRSPKRYVIVYDLGGGTFDTSAVSLEERRFELLRSEGIAQLGGDDFDAIILELALERARVDGRSLSTVARTRLLETCREAKEALGLNTRRLLVDLGSVLSGCEPVMLDTADIYERTQPLVDRTVELLDRVFESLRGHGIDPDNPRELGAVYLVGGATAFPPVARTLRKLHRRKIQLAPQAHAATALGLAIAADPDAGLFVREAVTRYFGVWREGESGREKVFDPVLFKNTTAGSVEPVRAVRSYRPVHAVGHLRFVECSELSDGGEPSGDLTPYGDLYFPYDPHLLHVKDLSTRAPERRPEFLAEEIVEHYEYGQDGTITVEIENSTRGYRRRYVMSNAELWR
ncbi:MAG: Hsp70 family protein [Polyangiaceae bacterium]|nr:Hsp70 family protein [Polyangiaceae bacterium]